MPRHQKPCCETVSFDLVFVAGVKSGSRDVYPVLTLDYGLDMTRHEVVAKFVGHAEVFESFVLQVCSVGNGKVIAQTDQHP